MVDSLLDREPASTWDFTLYRNGRNLEKLDIGASHRARGYAVLCIAPAGQFDTWRATFDRITSSLRWTD